MHLRKDGDVCQLFVRNTGTSLPAEFQDRLFDSLVSLREKRGRGPHLGLGLYIVRLVVNAHAGQVTERNVANLAVSTRASNSKWICPCKNRQ